MSSNDVALVLSALHDLWNGWPVSELVDGWKEAADRLSKEVGFENDFIGGNHESTI